MNAGLPLLCPPPSLQQDTRVRLIDKLLFTGVGRCAFFVLVAAGIIVAPLLGLRAGLALDAVTTFAAAAWCVRNFARCREAHCVVTGYGWTALAVVEVAELVLGRSLLMGDEGLVFVAILVVGIVFEVVWRLRHGTNALITPDATRRA